MKLGAMNHPGRNLADEIEWIGKHGFDFIDLTLEAPKANPASADPSLIADLCARYNLEVVGHTSPFIPIGSASEAVRSAAVDEHIRSLDFFASVGAKKVTFHVDPRRGAEPISANIENNLKSFIRLAEESTARGIAPMLEHFEEAYNNVANLKCFFDAVPQLLFHLDIGHANLWVSKNCTSELLKTFAGRLGHVHVSDNFGGKDDLHLPIGAGKIKWKKMVALLKRHGYDGTITVEVFSNDRAYLLYSRDRLRALWDGIDVAATFAPQEEEHEEE